MDPKIVRIGPNHVELTRYKPVTLEGGTKGYVLDSAHVESYGQTRIDENLTNLEAERVVVENYDKTAELAKLDARETELAEIQKVMTNG